MSFRWSTDGEGTTLGRFDALSDFGAANVVTTRAGFDVARAHAQPQWAAGRVAALLGLIGVAFARQVHGPDVLVVDRPGLAGQADALATDRLGLGVMGFSADCPLILVADSQGLAVGMAHASWRSTVAGITSRLVATMVRQLGSRTENLVACICPSAGPCCYEVGDDVRSAMADQLGEHSTAAVMAPAAGGKYMLDLWRANSIQLSAAGVPADNIHQAGVCTLCRNDLLPSYRREGLTAGRFVGAIGRRRVAD